MVGKNSGILLKNGKNERKILEYYINGREVITVCLSNGAQFETGRGRDVFSPNSMKTFCISLRMRHQLEPKV